MSKYSKKINRSSNFFQSRPKKIEIDKLKDYQKPMYHNANNYDFKVRGKNLRKGNLYDVDIELIRQSLIEDFANYMPLENFQGVYSQDEDYYVTTNWYPNDTKELFKSNMQDPATKSLLHKLNWIDIEGNPKQIDYNLNKNGFRCKNITENTSNGILFLGCSHTFGIGLKEEQTFASLVSKHFNRECFNYGVPGKGLDTLALYTSLFLQDDIDPSIIDAVVVYAPPPGRVSFFTYSSLEKTNTMSALELHQMQNDYLIPTNYYDNNYLPDIPSHKYDDAKDVFNLQHTDTREEIDKKLNAGLRSHVDSYRSRVIEHYMFTKENNFYRNILAISTIKTFCLENNIPLVVQQGSSTIASRHDWARDIGHFGPATHSNISKDIISQLNIHLT